MTTPACFIEPSELKRLSVLQPWRTGLALALDWAMMFGAAAFSIWADHWLAYIAAIFVIAGRQHAIAVLMHDFAHYRFISNKKVSDWIADLCIAWPLFGTYEGYRRNHLGHHRYLNTDKDPDWALKLGSKEFTFPQEIRFAALNLLGYLVGVSSIRDMRGILKRLNADNPETPTYKRLRLSYYLALAAVLTLTGGWFYYVAYWLVPYFTLFFMFMYIRSVADHFGETMDYSDEVGGTRTILATPIETFFLAPHNINYHAEHHSYASVPYYRLPELHAALMKNPEFASRIHITHGFIGLWRETVGTRRRAEKKMNLEHVPAAE